MLRALAPFLCVLAVSAAAGGSAPDVPDVVHPAADAVRPLPFYFDLYAFRGEGRRTAVVAAFAVPVEGLQAVREDWADRYRFDVTFVLADTALDGVTRTDDSVHVRVARGLAGDHLLHTHVEVQARPAAATLRRVGVTDANTPGRGQLYIGPYTVDDFRGSGLMLSDIALGLPDAEGGWRRGDVSLALLPTSHFPGSSFDVYYEIYNLPAGHRYDTEVTIEHLADEHGRPVEEGRVITLTFSGESAAGPDDALAELRRVDTSLPEGRYRLTVAVTDEVDGRTARRSRVLQVEPWGPGATLVPAMSRERGGG